MAKHERGGKIHTAMHIIRRKYVYNAAHDARSVVTIFTELAVVDQNRNMRDA